MTVQEVTAEQLEEYITSEGRPVVVDFWADWCGPCKMISPILDELSQELDYVFLKLNVDDHRETAKKYLISSIPAVLIYKDSEVVKEIIGARSKEMYIKDISEVT